MKTPGGQPFRRSGMTTPTSGEADLPEARCQACFDRNDGFYGSWAPDCPRHNYDGTLRATHVQNPAENEHVADDVLKNGAESNTSQQTAPAGAHYEKELEDALRERDEADDFIDTLLDEVLGADRAEWSNAYGRADALEEVRERITSLHKPAVDRAWKQFEAATKQVGDVVAYLDVGAGGYLDLEAALSDEAMQQLPKGRHALVIAGTYGIDGYVAAPQPAPPADSVLEDAAQYRWWLQFFDSGLELTTAMSEAKTGAELDAAILAARKQGGSHD